MIILLRENEFSFHRIYDYLSIYVHNVISYICSVFNFRCPSILIIKTNSIKFNIEFKVYENICAFLFISGDNFLIQNVCKTLESYWHSWTRLQWNKNALSYSNFGVLAVFGALSFFLFALFSMLLRSAFIELVTIK